MAQGEIHISEVLSEMEKQFENGQGFMFSIAFVRDNKSKNGERGSIKHVAKAIKGTRTSKNRKGSAGVPVKKHRQFKSFNGIPMIDLDTGQQITPKFTHIIQFNGQKVRHYGR